jgi:hypothetical protein
VKRRRKDEPPSLLYKVVEISAVDEASLERVVNEWVQQGWAFDGVQFAMRESSKRPSMAFVFFTKHGDPSELPARSSAAVTALVRDPHARLRQLAEGGDES